MNRRINSTGAFKTTSVLLIIIGILGVLFFGGYGYVFVENRLETMTNDSNLELRTISLTKYYQFDTEKWWTEFKYDKDGDMAYYAEHIEDDVPIQEYWRRKVTMTREDICSDGPTRIEAIYTLNETLIGCKIAKLPLHIEEENSDSLGAVEEFIDQFAPDTKQYLSTWDLIKTDNTLSWFSKNDSLGVKSSMVFRVKNNKVTEFLIDAQPPDLVKQDYDNHKRYGGLIRTTYGKFKLALLFLVVFTIGTLTLLKRKFAWKRLILLLTLGTIWFAFTVFKITLPASLGLVASVLCLYMVGLMLEDLLRSRLSELTYTSLSDRSTLCRRVLIGFLCGTICLVFALVYYGVITKTGLGWISLQSPPGSESMRTLGQWWHTLWYVAWEEVVFRMLLIPLFFALTRKKWVAVCIPAVLWSISHISSASIPFYLRILEVTFVGVIYGLVYLRYGIVSVLIAHWYEDYFLMLSASLPWLYWTGGIISLLVILLGLALLLVKSTKGLSQNKCSTFMTYSSILQRNRRV